MKVAPLFDVAIKEAMQKAVFAPEPDEVVFSAYDAGESVQAVLTLKNTTDTSQPIRILPPATTFFRVTPMPGNAATGRVAAGLAFQYLVTFAPDSRRSYDDHIQILAEVRMRNCRCLIFVNRHNG